MIVVERAPPYLTVQDAGRPGYRASGVPHCGAMDQWSFALANLLVGNRRDAAGLEWAVGAGLLRFEHDSWIALTGAEVEATIDDRPVALNSAVAVRAGQILTIHRLNARRFLYISVRGAVDCRPVLGSRSTYLPAAFGGIEGRRLIRGDVVPIGEVQPGRETVRGGDLSERATIVIRTLDASGVAPDYDAIDVRLVAASDPPVVDETRAESGSAGAGFLESFFETNYAVSLSSDRTGYRLEGDGELSSAGASITSQPVCAGAIQIPPNGHPIVLMADSPTIGGYRVVGTVISCDLPIVAQSMPGRKLRFVRVTIDVAQDELRRRELALAEIQ